MVILYPIPPSTSYGVKAAVDLNVLTCVMGGETLYVCLLSIEDGFLVAEATAGDMHPGG